MIGLTILLLLGGSFTSVIYPQGFSCDPVTGILYNLTATGNPYAPLRTPSGCTVNIETGKITCVAAPSGLTVAVQ